MPKWGEFALHLVHYDGKFGEFRATKQVSVFIANLTDSLTLIELSGCA
jgi:hypothetical protein